MTNKRASMPLQPSWRREGERERGGGREGGAPDEHVT